MPNDPKSVVSVAVDAPKLADGVLSIDALPSDYVNGCRVFTHYNGPTDQLAGVCTGMAVLDPGTSPHPPHRHPEEEFLIVSEGTGEIEVDGTVTKVGPGAILYCAGNTLHGIVNTGKVPLTFYWSKWMASGSTSKTYPLIGSRKKKRANGVGRRGRNTSAPSA